MEELVKPVVVQLLHKSLDQKTARNISKKVTDWPPDALTLLVTEVVQKLKVLLRDSTLQALGTVILLCEGCRPLQECVAKCTKDILTCCENGLQLSATDVHRKSSEIHISVKAVYGILQYIFPKGFTDVAKNDELVDIVQRLYLSLITLIVSDTLPSDCMLITSTAACLCLSWFDESRCRKLSFIRLLITIDEIKSKEVENYSCEAAQACKHLLADTEDTVAVSKQFRCIKPSLAGTLIIHGLLNSGAQWVYFECSQEGCEEHCVKETFLYEVYPLIEKLCKSASSYAFQAFQVLYMWLTCVRKDGKSLHDLDMKEATQTHPSEKNLFSLEPLDQRSVFHLLNSNWENPAKGVSDTVYSCMKELLELHEDGYQGKAKVLALQMLDALVSCAAWTSKSTYPPMALAISYVGGQKVVDRYPSLAAGLMTSLSVNHLAPPGASVYKMVISGLTSVMWTKYFLSTFLEALHSTDRLTRQHVLTLWIPATMRQYPNVYWDVLDGCQSSSAGWLARMSILKSARKLGLLTPKDFEMEKNVTRQDTKEEDRLNEVNSDDVYDNRGSGVVDVKRKSNTTLFKYVQSAMSHMDEEVRGEVLAFLCQTQKTSEPVTRRDCKFIKEFFTWNMNIDSASFRQSMVKCYRTLVIRLRDACAGELKSSPFRLSGSAKCIDLESMNSFVVTPILEINCELLLWFVKFFHVNMASDGNYQRRILSLKLYRETFLAFHDSTKDGKYVMNERCVSVCKFMNFISEKNVCKSRKESWCYPLVYQDIQFYLSPSYCQAVLDLTLPWTMDMLLSSCLDEMNDIREEAEQTLQILQMSSYGSAELEVEWLNRGLALCDSPKASDSESGASLMKVLSPAFVKSGHITSELIQNPVMDNHSESLLDFLFARVTSQFVSAQKNILEAARAAPIHGTLLALGRCLCEDNSTTEQLSSKEKRAFMEKLTTLMVEMVEYMLSRLACASTAGSAIAPSFAEMGEAVEKIIQECGGKSSTSPDDKHQNFYGDMLEEKEEEREEEEKDDGDDYEHCSANAISGDHLLVLACCWQTMKVCCIVSSMVVTHWLDCLDEPRVRKILRSVVIRVLMGTRHKGAMEAAKLAYSQLCLQLLSGKSKYGHLIHKQVENILDQLEIGAQTSITRRAAGVAMMVQVACGAAPRTNASLINTTVSRLLNIVKMEYEEQNTVDSSPVLALHILRSLVLHASLAHYLLQHLPNVTIACLHAFTSDSWALRNAALQLYGAVVPRMVGQKKVRDDSSNLNSLTTPEFLARHPVLADFLLDLLSVSSKAKKDEHSKEGGENDPIMVDKSRLTSTVVDSDKLGSNNKSREIQDHITLKESSALVPVLSLMVRLSPGTGLQQNMEISDILHCYRSATTRLLGSPIHTVRRLAALALVALTPIDRVSHVVTELLQLFHIREVSANQVNGTLLAIASFLDIYPSLPQDENLKINLCTMLIAVMGEDSTCYMNKIHLLKILKVLDMNISEFSNICFDHTHPGAVELFRIVSESKIEHFSSNEIESFIRISIDRNQEMEHICVNYIKDHLRMYGSTPWIQKIEDLLWQKIEGNSLKTFTVSPVLQILQEILEKQNGLKRSPSNQLCRNLLLLLEGSHGLRAASLTLVIVAYVVKDHSGHDITSKILSRFTSTVSKYSAPSSTEDYRLAACVALRISIGALLTSELCVSLVSKEEIIMACIDLLQDEDSNIRDSASYIIKSLDQVDHLLRKKCKQIETEEELILQDLETRHSESGFVNVLHPNLSLRKFARIIAVKSVFEKDWATFKIVWKLCCGPEYYNTEISAESFLSRRFYLFQSHSVNLYKEPRQLSLVMAEAILKALELASGDEVIYEQLCRILKDECQAIDRQGIFLQNILSQCSHLVTDKQLLSAVSTYDVVVSTFLYACKTLNLSVRPSFIVCWNPSRFCSIDLS